METICLHFELRAPAEPMAEPNRTARRLARENRILRRTCAACLAAMFAALAWYTWDGLQARKTYDLLKTSARQTAQAAEQRAQDYRAEADRLQCQLDACPGSRATCRPATSGRKPPRPSSSSACA